MRAKKRFRNLSGNINRDTFGTGTVDYCIDELSVTDPGRTIRTSREEK
jgi:hypothetical protein